MPDGAQRHVDELMAEIGSLKPRRNTRVRPDSLPRLKMTFSLMNASLIWPFLTRRWRIPLAIARSEPGRNRTCMSA